MNLFPLDQLAFSNAKLPNYQKNHTIKDGGPSLEVAPRYKLLTLLRLLTWRTLSTWFTLHLSPSFFEKVQIGRSGGPEF